MNTDKADQTGAHASSIISLWLKSCCACVAALALSSCVYVPVVDEPDTTASCKTYTKTMSLETVEIHENIFVQPGCDKDCAAAALGSVIVVTAGSALISGSIVLTGNTIHWLEYHGTCSDGYLSKAKQLFLASIGQASTPGK